MILINTFSNYLKERYNERLWKIPLSTGYPCPNRINGKTGCTFCNEVSFVPGYLKENDTLNNQIKRSKAFFGNRYKVNNFIGYFQFNTSTYGPKDEILNKFDTVLKYDDIKALMISTRPDYTNEEIVQGINQLALKHNKDIWIELGLQSTSDKTLKRINRNHTYQDFKDAVSLIKKEKLLKITVHMIIGLPGEHPEFVKQSINKLVTENDIDGIKFRLLEIISGTLMEDDYNNSRSDFFDFNFDNYSNLISDLLEIVPKDVVIMRLLNHKSIDNLMSTNDKSSKNKVLDNIKRILMERDSYQGKYFDSKAVV